MAKSASAIGDYFKETECYPPTVFELDVQIPSESSSEKLGGTYIVASLGWSVPCSNYIRRNIGWETVLRGCMNLFFASRAETTNAGAESDCTEDVLNEEIIHEKVLLHNSCSVYGHNNEKSLLYQVRSKNWQSIPDKYLRRLSAPALPPDLFYDDNGATLVHQCFQYQRYEMVKWLVRNFPKFSLEPYRSMRITTQLPYGGQNLLHMAVLAKTHEFARWLLDFYSKYSDYYLFKLLTARVVTRKQSYFRKTGKHYYGETPLQFAVCMNDHAMVDLILSFTSLLHTELRATNPAYSAADSKIPAGRNLLFMPDCNGNNVIILCVIHKLPTMYDHVKYIALEMIRQELMRSFHIAAVGVIDKKYKCDKDITAPIGIDYEKYFGIDIDYGFTGFIRKLGEIDFPSWPIRELFVGIQAAKLKLLFEYDNGSNDKDSSKLLALKELKAKATDDNDRLHWLHHKMLNPNANSLDLQEGSLYNNDVFPEEPESTTPKPVFFKLFDAGGLYFNKHEYSKWFSAREDELKQEMRQWLYGTDSGLNLALKNGAVHRLFNELYILGLNEDGHSPITLAAARGKAEILRHLIVESVISRDSNYDFDLTAIEFPVIQCDKERSEYKPPVRSTVLLRSAIWWICRNELNNALIESIPEIKAVIAAKWERVGYLIANRNNQLHVTFLVPLMVLTCLVMNNNDEFSDLKVKHQFSTYLLTACSAVFLAIVGTDLVYMFWWSGRLPNLMQALISWKTREVSQEPYAGLSKTISRRWTIIKNRSPVGAGLFDLCMRLVIGGVFVSIIFVRFYRNVIRDYYVDENFVNKVYCTLIGACCLCSMIYSFLFLLLAEDKFGSFLVTVTRIILKDFVYFARFWLRIVVMFGLALKTITENIDDSGFRHAFRCMWALIRLSFPNGVPTNEFEPLASQHQFETVWFSFLTTLFCLLVNILIINLLIAVMSNTYNEFNGEASAGKSILISYIVKYKLYVV
jgi:hypothetical protein